MKKWLTIVCLSSYSLFCQATPQQLLSTIKAVTVYTDRAVVTRYAEIELSAGEHELVFENLPVQLDNNSLQVTASASSAATILDVTSIQARLKSNTNERLQKLDQQRAELKKQLANLQDQQLVITNQLTFIHDIQTSATAINDKIKRPTGEQLQQILNLTSGSMQTLLADQRQLNSQQQQLNQQLNILNQQYLPLDKERHLQVKHVSVRVLMAKAGKLKLNLNYLIFGASWSPLYDVRLNSQQQQLSLSYKANVVQQTGEDWQHVKLTLSTARPALGGNAPTLGNWQLAIANNETAPLLEAKADYDSAAENSAKMMSSPSANLYKPTARQVVNINTNMTSTSFNISQPTSLMSGGSKQQVTIAIIDHLKADLVYKIIPRLQPTAYLQADMNNNSDYPLLAGNLAIFMDGHFIATSQLKTTMPYESFKLDLGVDEAIAVTFKQLKRYTEKTGFTNSNERITYQYEITVQNNKIHPVKVQINDHIPVSQSDNIKVKLLSPTHIQPDKQGKLTWQNTLSPAEKQLIPISFSVEYPAKIRVKGLQKGTYQ